MQEDLWEGHAPPSAASTLKSHISLLRRVLGHEHLTNRDGGYVLVVDPADVDASQFEADAAAGRAAMHAGDLRRSADLLGRALERWRGAVLTDAGGAAWAAAEVARLDELRAATIERRFEVRLALGEHREVVGAIEAAVAEHPLREGLWAALMLALYRCGRQADALRAYGRVRAVLLEDLGVSPGPQLAALEAAVLRHDPDLLGPSVPEEPWSAGAPDAQANNLPTELTSFIGREVPLREVTRLLAHERLVTLCGAGGIGKTRIALRVARMLAAAPGEGVWLAELASATDAAGVVREVRKATGVQEEPGADPLVAVTHRLADGRHLVVLDNCEHVRADACTLVAELLVAAPGLRILATSREPLGHPTEVVYRVPSMALPGADEADPQRLGEFEAVRLLTERALHHEPSFALGAANCQAAASLCRRLDGIPLALELAAARLRTMTLSDLERRLDGRFRLLTGGGGAVLPRQQTLQALIDWSFDLLGPRDREVFCRLAVFAGPWDLAAAEVVAGSGALDRWDVVESVSSLVDKSLVQADTTAEDGRYRMLETVRHYASARLSERGAEDEAISRAAHAALFLELAERAAPHFSGPGHAEWRRRLEADHDNLLTAFGFVLRESDGADATLRFAVALGWFWTSSGSYGEAVELTEAALHRPGADHPTALRCAALCVAGHLLCRGGALERASKALEEALAIARATGADALMADALRNLAWVADRRGDHEQALALATAAVDHAMLSGDAHVLARAFDVRAAARQDRDPDGARTDYAHALESCEAAGDHHGKATALNNLAVLELAQGNNDVARQHFALASTVAQECRSAGILPYLDYGVGLAAALDGDNDAAAPVFARVVVAARQTGQRSLIAYALLGLAVASDGPGRAARSATLHGAARTLFDELREAPEPLETRLQRDSIERLQAELGDSFRRSYDLGRAMPISRAIAFGLDGMAPATRALSNSTGT